MFMTHCCVQSMRLVQGEKLFQVMDQNQAIVEFDHALELLEARYDPVRTDDGGLLAFDDAVGLIDHQRHHAPGRPCDQKLVDGADLPLREEKPSPKVEHGENA